MRFQYSQAIHVGNECTINLQCRSDAGSGMDRWCWHRKRRRWFSSHPNISIHLDIRSKEIEDEETSQIKEEKVTEKTESKEDKKSENKDGLSTSEKAILAEQKKTEEDSTSAKDSAESGDTEEPDSNPVKKRGRKPKAKEWLEIKISQNPDWQGWCDNRKCLYSAQLIVWLRILLTAILPLTVLCQYCYCWEAGPPTDGRSSHHSFKTIL